MNENLTIIDIARMAGVSKSTVSRVLNNEPRVKPETKEAVLKVIEESGYFPSEVARTLVKSKSKLVGLITPFQCRSFYRNELFRDAFTGLTQVLKKYDYDIITSSGSGVELDTIQKFVRTYHVCGVILLYTIPDDPSLHYLLENHVPFSVIGACEGFTGINQVTYDYQAAMVEIVDSLLEQNRTRIAFFASDTGLSTTRSYIEGYRTGLERRGMPVLEKYLLDGMEEEQAIYSALRRYQHTHTMPDAIIASDDIICCHLLRFCQEEKIRIPEDMALFSLENGPVNEAVGISCINLDYIRMGNLAGKMLIDTVEHGQTTRIQLNHQLLHRRSSQKSS